MNFLSALARAGSGWSGRLAVAGEPLTTAQWQMARDAGVAHRIVEIGRADDAMLRNLYNQAFALLFPSRHEGFGWPLIEAQACACPVICSDHAPMPEVTGGAASLCPADDADAFAGAIIALANEPARREKLVEAGLRNAAAHTPNAMAASLRDFYVQVLAGG